MSLTLNMVGGGGGGLSATDALLRVQAPAGSTVTITKGTTTKTDLGHENALDTTVYDYYFIIHQSQFDSVNPWTVTATLGTQTASDTVVIDAADEYDVTLVYRLWIYQSGVGQVQTLGYARSGSNVTWNDNNERIQITASGSSGNTLAFGTENTVDVTNYNKLVIEILFQVSTDGKMGLYSTKYNTNWGTPIAGKTSGLAVGENVIDISSVSGSYYIGYVYFVTRAFSNIYLEV